MALPVNVAMEELVKSLQASGQYTPEIAQLMQLVMPGVKAGAQQGTEAARAASEMGLKRQGQAGGLRTIRARGAESRRMKKFEAVELEQAKAIAAERSAEGKAEGQRVKVRKLQREAHSILHRGSSFAGPSQYVFESKLAQMRDLPEGGGIPAAETLRGQSDAARRATVEERMGRVKQRYLRAGQEPPPNVAERVGTAVAEGKQGIRTLNQRIDAELKTASTERYRARGVAEIEGLRGGGGGAKGAMEEALAEIGKQRTKGGIQAAKTAGMPRVEKALARGRLGKGALIGSLGALVALPIFKHLFGKKDDQASEISPQQQFQLAMAMAQQGKGGDQSLETGRELMNIQRVLRIIQTLQQAQGTQLQPSGGIV